MAAERGSRAWRVFFRAAYRLIRLLDPILRAVLRVAPRLLPRVVDLRVAGRRSGRVRHTLLTLLTVDGNAYVGHPNGEAAWTQNLEAAATAELTAPGRSPQQVRAVRLWAAPERERIVRATWSQQPFPANVAYALARNHVRAVGVFFRLLPVEEAG